MYSLLLAVIYLAFISLGLPDSLLGAGWPSMHTALGAPLSAAGVISMIISGATIVSSLLSERLTRKFSAKNVVLFSVILSSASLFAFSRANSFLLLCIIGVPYGLAAGSIDAALNNYVALHYNSRHMSWLHCFWGVGAIVSPYIMSLSLTYSTWRTGYFTVSMIQIGIAVILAATVPLWKINKDPAEETGENTGSFGIMAALRIRGVPAVLFGFLGYCAAEWTCMLWAASYLTETRGVTEERAAAFASLVFIGLTAGRFIAGFFSERAGDRNMIRAGTAVVAVGIIMIAVPALPEFFSLAGFVVIGFGFAPVYPSIIHSTPHNFGKTASQAIIGMQMAFAYVGSMFAPALFGLISSFTGLWIMPFYLAAFFVLMIIMIETAFRKASNKKDGSVSE
ncbi:MAG: MFS transporter [Clostridia bacterium]|nr:MFS transporter [Clostridia bacterium]